MRINVSVWSVALTVGVSCLSGILGARGEITIGVLCGMIAGLITAIDYTWHNFNKGENDH